MMTSITVSDTNSPRTVVSTFTTEPDRQAELLALLSDQADTLLSGSKLGSAAAPFTPARTAPWS
jgi:hypothetical protein